MSKVTEIRAKTDVLQKPVLQREDLQPAHLAMYDTYEALRSYIHLFHSFYWVSCVKSTDHWQSVCLVAVRPLLSHGTCMYHITLHVPCTSFRSASAHSLRLPPPLQAQNKTKQSSKWCTCGSYMFFLQLSHM
jgi:hypothetical protein